MILTFRYAPEHGVRVRVNRDQRGRGRLQLHQRGQRRRRLALGQRLEQLPEADHRQQRARRLEEELAAARAAHAHAAAAAVGCDRGRALQRLQNDRDESVSAMDGDEGGCDAVEPSNKSMSNVKQTQQ